MKTLLVKLFSVVILLSVFTTSCKDDENGATSLIGTWRFVSSASSGCGHNDNETCTVACATLTFTETTVISSHDPGDPTDYTIEGNTIILDDGDETGTFSISGSTLTLVFTEDDGGCTVTETEVYIKGDLLPAVDVSESSLTILAEGGTNVFDITANVNWSVASSETWLTVSPTSGTGEGTQTVTVTAEANPTTEEREATVTITATGLTAHTITVTQEALVGVTPESLVGTWEITVSEGTEWEKDDGVITPRASDPGTLGVEFTFTATTVTVVSAEEEEWGTFDYTINAVNNMITIEGVGDFSIANFDGSTMQLDQREPDGDEDYEYNEEGDNYLYFQKFWTMVKQ